MKCQRQFSGKSTKTVRLSSAELVQRVINVNDKCRPALQ